MSDNRCKNCNVRPEDFEEGHSFRLKKRGFAYDIQNLNGLGMVEENGVRLIFDRMNNRLIVERKRLTLSEIANELEAVIDDE